MSLRSIVVVLTGVVHDGGVRGGHVGGVVVVVVVAALADGAGQRAGQGAGQRAGARGGRAQRAHAGRGGAPRRRGAPQPRVYSTTHVTYTYCALTYPLPSYVWT